MSVGDSSEKKTTVIPVGVTKPGVADVMMIRDMTFRLGALHEVQVKNLKIWPRLFIGTHVEEIRYGHADRRLELELSVSPESELNLTEGPLKLDKCVKFLLGPDVALKVFMGGKQIYYGGPRDDSWLSNSLPSEKESSSKTGFRSLIDRLFRRP